MQREKKKLQQRQDEEGRKVLQMQQEGSQAKRLFKKKIIFKVKIIFKIIFQQKSKFIKRR